jgi:hypothetical protein
MTQYSRDAPWHQGKSITLGRALTLSHAPTLPPTFGRSAVVVCLGLAFALMGCDGTLDAGRNEQQGLLPVDHHNPVIIVNDSVVDNWAAEFSVLLANNGGPTVVGIVVDTSEYWPHASENLTAWNAFVTAARASGLQHVPDVTLGASAPLSMPANRKIDSTLPLGSAGAQLILDRSRRLSLPGQPLVVVTGTQLTDLADAYLMDPSVVDRVIVVASLGLYSAPKGSMTGPNGDLDPWADWIVAQRFSYVQVSVSYDQTDDVRDDDIESLPKNLFGEWMAAKQSHVLSLDTAADQIAVLAAAGLPSFVTTTERCAPDTSGVFNPSGGQGPTLLPNAAGNVSLVTQVATSRVRRQLWHMLQDTFGPS